MLTRELLTVQAVVLDQSGRVLLQFRSWPPGWEPPGGHLDPGEEPELSVARETLEETGLELEVGKLVGYYRFAGIRRGTDAVFRARVRGGSPHSNREALALRWVEPSALPRALFPWFRQRIQDALEDRPGPPLERVQPVSLGQVLRHGLSLTAELGGLAAERSVRLRGG